MLEIDRPVMDEVASAMSFLMVPHSILAVDMRAIAVGSVV